MPTKTAVASFDYASLDKDTAQFLQQQTGEIRALMRRSAQDIFEIGQKLIEIKQRLGHGQFLEWLRAEFNWTSRTAERFMNVAKRFGNKIDILSNLNIPATALYLLAAPSIDEELREEALELAETEPLTAKKVESLKKQHQAKKAPPRQRRRHKTYQPKTKESQSKKEQVTPRPTTPPSPPASIPPPLPSKITAAEALIEVKGTPVDKPIEIVSIRPPAFNDAIPETETPQLLPDTWHQVGKHRLFCGYPNSPLFQEKLPEKLSLVLAFPRSPDWQLNKPVAANSAFAFYSGYQDLEPDLLRQTVSNLLLLCTEDKEEICFAFLPDPHFLQLAQQMGCQAFIAEPDPQRCQALLNRFAEVKSQKSKVKSRIG